MRRRSIVLSLDGLNRADLGFLLSFLPQSRKVLEAGALIDVTGKPLASAQALWAELLTGKPWYDNGCAGYARPVDSLNKLEVMSERELRCTCQLLSGSEAPGTPVVINVPLVKPDPSRLIWLSDGSLPLNQIVSPRKLTAESPFSDYKPRPYPDIATGLGLGGQSIQSCFEVETRRLACALRLSESTDWNRFVCRLSLFDQLTHLVGPGFLGSAEDLQLHSLLKPLMSKLDEFLCSILQRGHRLVLISLFSHVACRARLNLNLILRQGGLVSFLPDGGNDRQALVRMQASEALGGEPPSTTMLGTLEGRLDPSKTIAASPVSGCIFLNRRDAFSDGIVEAQQYQELRTRTGRFLQDALESRFGRTVVLEANPKESPIQSTPEFVVSIPGVEFHDMSDEIYDHGVPHSTHQPDGFLLTVAEQADLHQRTLRPSQITEMLGSER